MLMRPDWSNVPSKKAGSRQWHSHRRTVSPSTGPPRVRRLAISITSSRAQMRTEKEQMFYLSAFYGSSGGVSTRRSGVPAPATLQAKDHVSFGDRVEQSLPL